MRNLFVFFILSTLSSFISGYIGSHWGDGSKNAAQECHRFEQPVNVKGHSESGYVTACRDGDTWKTKFITDSNGNEIAATEASVAEVPKTMTTKTQPRFIYMPSQTIAAAPEPVRTEIKQ